MSTRHLVPSLAAAALAVAATTAVILPGATAPVPLHLSSASADEARVLTFTISKRGYTEKFVDAGRRGESLGDRYLTGLSVEQDGRLAGRVLVECLAIDGVYDGRTCELSMQLTDGTLYLRGMGFHRAIPHVGTGSDTVYAVTGGSGAYADARGEAFAPADGDTISVSLQP